MSNLNALELDLLMRRVMNPAPKKSMAQYKKESRARVRALSKNGKLALNSETMAKALLDTLSEVMADGDPDGIVQSLVARAAKKFVVPEVAILGICHRLSSRRAMS